MKRMGAMLLVLAAVLALGCMEAKADGTPWKGSGTEASPWLIETVNDLVALREYTNTTENGTTGKYFRLMCDLDLSSVCSKSKGDWTPIGVYESGEFDPRAFDGTFDGGGHTIEGLYIGSGGNQSGLFGKIEKNGTVKNLSVEGTVKGGVEEVGGIVGHNAGTISSCTFDGEVEGEQDSVGGIAGYSIGATIMDCTVDAEVSGTRWDIGGIVGYADKGCSIIRCTVEGTVEGEEDIGGIIGYAHTYVTIDHCSFDGDVAGTEEDVGGIVGFCYLNSTISNCTAKGSVESTGGEGGVGGIVGVAQAQVTNCVNYCTVKGGSCIGGIAGTNANAVRYCENHGKVKGDGYLGGIVGRMFKGFGSGKICVENCINYADISTSGGCIAGIVALQDIGTITNCTNYGDMSGYQYIGGIVGNSGNFRIIETTEYNDTFARENPISYCVNYGDITCEEWYAGGLAAFCGAEFYYCNTYGKVSGATNYGGFLVGYGYKTCVRLLPNCEGNGEGWWETCTEIAECPFTNGKYSFFAWNTEPDGSGDYFCPGDTHPWGVTLYAIWMERGTVSYNGGTADAWILNDSILGLPSGWFAAVGNMTINKRLMIRGNDANLIIKDGVQYSAQKGVSVFENKSLTIWGQSEGTGKLIATGDDDDAGIGGIGSEKEEERNCGSVTICGGYVVATGGKYGAGIGGGDEGSGGTVTVRGGTVEAAGTEGAAGIGGGDYGNGGAVYVYGGTVEATGSVRSKTSQAAAGIGAGRPRQDGSSPLSSQECMIYGGTVIAVAGSTEASIGAQAIGTNYADAARAGRVAVADHLNATVNNAGTPVDYGQRESACREGKVMVTGCRYHSMQNNACKYCGATTGLEGTGTSGSPILIQSDADWYELAYLVNNGYMNTRRCYFEQTEDIYVEATMLGTKDHPFCGFYDGGGCTISFSNGEAGIEYCAPFQYIDGAWLQGLYSSTRLSPCKSYSGGLAASVSGDSVIIDCIVNSAFYAESTSVTGLGGVVGTLEAGASLRIEGCFYSGKIKTNKPGSFAAFVGAARGSLTLRNCINSTLDADVPARESQNFAIVNGGSVELDHCYRLNSVRGQGTPNNQLIVSDGLRVMFLDFDAGYRTSGIALYGDCISYTVNDKTLYYAMPGAEIAMLMDGEISMPDWYQKEFSADSGVLENREDIWILTMGNARTQISVTFKHPLSNLPGEGTAENPYQIGTEDDWEFVSSLMEDGIPCEDNCLCLTEDIGVSSMLGTSATPFTGVFDGAGHTLEVLISSTESFAAPFRFVDGATIKNLRVTGTVSGGMHCSGLVGVGACVIENCEVAAKIITSGTHCGGFIGHNGNYAAAIRGCVFSGSIEGAAYAGTFWGWSDAGAEATVADCLDVSGSAHPIGRGSGTVNVSNTYYTYPEKQTGGSRAWKDQGKRAFMVLSLPDSGLMLDFGEGAEYGYDGITAYPAGLSCWGVYYAGAGESVIFSIIPTDMPEGFEIRNVSASAGEIVRNDGLWMLTLAAEDAVVYADAVPGLEMVDFFLPAALTVVEEDSFFATAAQSVFVPKKVAEIQGDPFAESSVEWILGYPGSAAEIFAMEYGYVFFPIDDQWLEGE